MERHRGASNETPHVIPAVAVAAAAVGVAGVGNVRIFCVVCSVCAFASSMHRVLALGDESHVSFFFVCICIEMYVNAAYACVPRKTNLAAFACMCAYMLSMHMYMHMHIRL